MVSRVAMMVAILMLVTGCAGKITTVHFALGAAPPPTKEARLAAAGDAVGGLVSQTPLGRLNCAASSVSPKSDVTMGVAACFDEAGKVAFGGVTQGVSDLDAILRAAGIIVDVGQIAATVGAAAIIADGMKAAAKAVPTHIEATTTGTVSGNVTTSGTVSTTGSVGISNMPNLNVNPIPNLTVNPLPSLPPVTGNINLVPFVGGP